MPGPIRRLLTGSVVLAFAAGTGLVVAPAPAYAGTVSGTVRVDGTLKVRKGPSSGSALVSTLRNGSRVRIACSVTGQYVRGPVRATRAWDRLTNGRYISHAYVRTTARIATCRPQAKAPAAAPGPVAVTVNSGDGPVNLRTGPSTLTSVKGTAANGSRLSVSCAVNGEYVVGSVRSTSQWDRLTDGRFVSHAYVTSGAIRTCPGSTAPTPTMTNAQFIAAAAPGAQRGWREFGVPPSVTIAQSILESGWGRSGLAATDRNYFGIKCFSGYRGPIAAGCHTYNTTECDKAGKCFGTSATFRTYRTVTDSFRDHGHFLRNNSRYKPAFGYTKNANAFLYQIKKAGYATDPDYVAKVKNLMTSYNLYRYDTWK